MTEAQINHRHFSFQVAGPFVTSCIFFLFTGGMAIVFVYIVELKATFHYSQTQAEIHTACHMIGKRFIPLLAIVYDRFGFYGTAITGAIASEGGVLLMGIATRIPDAFSQLSPLIFCFQFMIANGRAHLYYLSVMKTIEAFSKQHTGKAVSLLATMPVVGQAVFTNIYSNYFADVTLTSSYFFIGFAFTSVTILGYILIYAASMSAICKPNDVEEECLMHNLGQAIDTCSTKDLDTLKGPQHNRHDSGSVMFLLSSYKFHLFLWSGTLLASINFVAYANMRLYLETMNKDDIQARVVTVMLFMIIIARLTAGIAYDVLTENNIKVLIFLSCSISNILSFAVILLWPDNTAMIFVSSILVGVTMGIIDPFLMSYTKAIFGWEHFAVVQSIRVSCTGIFTSVFSVITGLLYDRVTKQSSSVENYICRGSDCYRLSYFILLIISILSMFLVIGLKFVCYLEYKTGQQKEQLQTK